MKEFIVLMAFLMALVAISIDAMLPALGLMAADLGVERANNIQFVVVFIFIGMTLGQIVYGPLSDAIGRKPTLFIGIGLYMAGTVLCWLSHSLSVMLVGRLVQGLGVSGPRTVINAIVRDKFQGRDMAYVMSMVMGIFILVPAIAPTLGQAIIHFAGWREIFLFYLIASVVALLWSYFRLEETLTAEHHRPFSIRAIWAGVKEAARTRVTLGYSICSGLSFGGLLGYLNSTQQIFQEIFHAGDNFAIYFGLLACAIGASFFTNSALVRRFGMRRITRDALLGMMFASLLFLPYTLMAEPNLVVFLLFAGFSFFCVGLTFGNMSAMALEPMGHMAGLASAFMGSFSSLISMALGALIGQLYDGTLVPLATGFFFLSVASFAAMQWTERGRAAA